MTPFPERQPGPGNLTLLLVLAALTWPFRPGLAGVADDLDAVRRLGQEKRWAGAESLAAGVLQRLENAPEPDSLAMAEALYRIGQARWKLKTLTDGVGLSAAARALEIRRRRLGPDHGDVAASHLLAGRILLEADRADSALFHARRGLEIRLRQLSPDDTLLADAWSLVGDTERNRRDLQPALEAYGRALDIREKVHGPEHPAVAYVLGEIGYCRYQLRDFDAARELLERAIGMYERTVGHDADATRGPMNYLASLERATGNIARAADLLLEALRIAKLHHGDDEPRVILLRANFGVQLLEIGDYPGARATFSALLPLFTARYGADDSRTARVHSWMANACHLSGDTAQALAHFAEAERIYLAHPGPPEPTLAVVTRWQGEIYGARGDFKAARERCERAIRLERSARQPWGETLAASHYLLLTILGAVGDTAALDSARTELLRLADAYALGSTATRASVRYYNARALRRLGRPAEAWSEALEAESLARGRLKSNVQALPDRRALQLSRKEWRQIDLVLDLARRDPARIETAWDRVIRSRGMVNAELARRRIPAGLQSDTLLAVAHWGWVEAQRRYAQRLVSTAGSSRDSASVALLDQLRSAAEEAERAYSLAVAGRRQEPTPADPGLADVRARLLPGQALAAVVEIAAKSDTPQVAVLVARGGSDAVELVELGRSSALRAALIPWLEALAAVPGSGPEVERAERRCRDLGRAVRALTWDRIAPALAGADDVYLVPDGPLLDLSWQALPDDRGAYLVEKGPRIHLLDAERDLTHPEETGSGSLLAIGEPDFDRGGAPAGEEVVLASLRSQDGPCDGRPAFEPLPGTGEEVDAVAGGWRGAAEVLRGPSASEEAFKLAAPGREVIHIATHGVAALDTCILGSLGLRGVGGIGPVAFTDAGKNVAGPAARTQAEASPWYGRRVWLALAGANRAGDHGGDENEGLLTAEEVLTLDLSGTDWVVLSACHSGLAESWSREGALGMRRAFRLAGARTVIFSRWAVADEATAEWMKALYAARAAGAHDAAAATASASRAVLDARRLGHRSTHPFYWAAFGGGGE